MAYVKNRKLQMKLTREGDSHMLNPALSSCLEDKDAQRGGAHFFIRSIRTDDEAALRHMLRHASEDDMHLRCFRIMKDFSEVMAKRFVTWHTGMEAALVALRTAVPNEIYGVAHFICSAQNRNSAEFDILVRSDFQSHHLSYALIREMLQRARRSGVSFLESYIPCDHAIVLQVVDELGFKTRDAAYGVVHVAAPLKQLMAAS
jgi:acetyltransferase